MVALNPGPGRALEMPVLVFERVSASVDETGEVARDLSLILRAGDVVRLDGPMGAGKTTFVRALAHAMGAAVGGVSSPTFVLMNEYETGETRPDLAHIDAYRLHGEDDAETLGLEELLESARAVVLIEWAERLGAAVPEDAARIEITPTGEHDRLLTITLPADWEDRGGVHGLKARRDTVCPATGVPVPADSPSWPFADDRERKADLYKWLTGQHVISRPMEERDLEEGVD